jgi:hypothetical protein
MLGNYRVAAQLVASRVVLGSTGLVSHILISSCHILVSLIGCLFLSVLPTKILHVLLISFTVLHVQPI